MQILTDSISPACWISSPKIKQKFAPICLSTSYDPPPRVVEHAQSVFPGDAPACAMTAGVIQGTNFCLNFGDEIQQSGQIAKVNQYFMP